PLEQVPLILAAVQMLGQAALPRLPQYQGARAVHCVDPAQVPAVAVRSLQLPEVAQQPAAALLVHQQAPGTRQRNVSVAFAFPAWFGCHGEVLRTIFMTANPKLPVKSG